MASYRVRAGAGTQRGARIAYSSAADRVFLSWSSGKDSAMALHRLQADPRYEVVGLLTTVSAEFSRISHHGVREELLEVQAAAIGLPLQKIYYGGDPDADAETEMARFETSMGELLADLRAGGVGHVAYGDIFLRELREYRKRRMRDAGMNALFPLWGEDTATLLRSFTEEGFRAVVTCAEPAAESLAGCDLSSERLDNDWPEGVDPCGENGEFHTFVHAGPIFRSPIPIRRGETIVRADRHYTDLIHDSYGTDNR